ncbi:DUF6412 domain-containing protein [Naasia sp. SYSU D00057]|uniref:DUF6412 domain-containing protein n=1 Tax=Naasia sp. SYSU D00057 TaxID=2817380 RepID=UPI001B300446|nr:DUF6412 domain-containing protein [Naasia sp. SYSU D00057]
MRSALVLLAPLVALLDGALAAGGPLSAVVLAGLLGAATSLVALAVVLVVLGMATVRHACSAAALVEAAETRILVWHRNPDAAGHVRSRAPGRGIPAV